MTELGRRRHAAAIEVVNSADEEPRRSDTYAPEQESRKRVVKGNINRDHFIHASRMPRPSNDAARPSYALLSPVLRQTDAGAT